MPRIIKTFIGFGINFADMIHHYAPIWRLLGVERIGVVPFGSPQDRREIASAAREFGCTVFDADTLIAEDTRFETFVSHQYLAMAGDRPIFKLLGEYNLRFMYSLAQDGWNFAEWNVHYDGFLCYGPYQAERFSAQFPGSITAQMGYPRFDDFFRGEIALDEVRQGLSCNPEKRTLVWLPTYNVFSSIDRYCDALAGLTRRFNVVVKPHPYTVTGESKRMERLRAAGFTHVIDNLFDNQKLLAIADWVVCDYGGPIFGALYTDRNLLLLDLPGASDHELVGPNSPEIRVRQEIATTDAVESDAIEAILNDDSIWEYQVKARQTLRKQFFAPFYGFSADIAATLLENAPRIFGKH